MRLAILLALLGSAAGAVETIRTFPQACADVLPALEAALDRKEMKSDAPLLIGAPTIVSYRGGAWGWLAPGMIRRYSVERGRGPWQSYRHWMAMLELHPSPDKCRVQIEATHQGLLDDTAKLLRKTAARR